jgi:predicted Rossmann fold nucleotide-binding protein DprA/Smf involved in DNA uptake
LWKFYLNAELNLIQKKRMLMKQLKRDFQSVLNSLSALTQKTDKMIKQLEKLDKAQAAKKPKAKAVKKAVAKKPAKMSASGTVLAIIKRSKKGVDTLALKNKTGLKDSNIRTILYRLSKQGKIKTERKGLYVKA